MNRTKDRLRVREERLLVNLQLKSIRERAEARGHTLGPWRYVRVRDADLLRNVCSMCKGHVLATLDGRRVAADNELVNPLLHRNCTGQ